MQFAGIFNAGSLSGELSRQFDASWCPGRDAALLQRCFAEPGPYQAPAFVTVPALRSGMKNAAPRPGHHVAIDTAMPMRVLFAKRSPRANTFLIIKPGGDVMTSRLAPS